MQFANPQILWLLWLLPLLAGSMILWRRQAAGRAHRFARPALLENLLDSFHPTRRFWRSTLRLLALTLLLLAAARPQWGASEVEVEQKGIDLVVALDISRSMMSQDIQPDRLTRASLEIGDLVESLRGDRVGLVFFAGAAFPQCPLTVDYSAVRLFLSQADPTMIGAQGTNIGSALETAMELFDEEDGRYRVILLVTDGEDFAGGLEDIRSDLSRKGILLYAIGMGTAEGSPIPQFDEMGRRSGFFKDEKGNVVISRLEEAALVEMSRMTGGFYARAGSGGLDLGRLRSELDSMEGRSFAAHRVSSYQERFEWPLGAAIFLLLLEAVLVDRRRKA